MDATVDYSRLVKCRPGDVAKGDTVWERVVYGRNPERVRWNEARVIATNRGAATVCFKHKHEERMLAYSEMWIMPEPKREAAKTPEPPPVVASDDDQVTAWLSMGRELLGGLQADLERLESEHNAVTQSLEQVDVTHRRRIEELEAELIEAKRAHQEDRALLNVQRERIGKKLEALRERRRVIQQAVKA